MPGVLPENRSKMLFAVDQHPVGALGSCGAYPSLGVTVARGVRGGVFAIFTPSPAKIWSKALANLASRSRMTKRKELILAVLLPAGPVELSVPRDRELGSRHRGHPRGRQLNRQRDPSMAASRSRVRSRSSR